MGNIYKLPEKQRARIPVGIPADGMTLEAWVFAALYVSEGWYDTWVRRKSLHAKARAVVLYDRVLNKGVGYNGEDYS